MPFAAPRRHEGAHVGGRQLGQLLERGRAAEMIGEKIEELADVALIGFERLRRHALFGAEKPEPADDFGGHVGWRRSACSWRTEWHRFLHPSLSARNWPRSIAMSTRVIDVLVPVALDQTYSYRVPAGLELAPGDLVCVPLGARGETMGVVWAENPTPNPRLHNRLKDVADKLDVPPLKPELRKFVDWVADYTLAPRGMVLRMTLRMGEHLGPGARARRRAARRAAAGSHDAGAGARAVRVRRRHDARQRRRRARGGRFRRRDRRPDRRGHAGNRGAAAGAGDAAARSGFPQAGILARRSWPPPTRCAPPSTRAATP